MNREVLSRRWPAVASLATLLVPLLLAAAGLPPASRAAEAPKKAERGRVVETVDGDTVRLDSGVEVRLVGIQAPKLPLGRRDFPTQPLAAEARAALAALVEGREVTLWYGGAFSDRHGRLLAHLSTENVSTESSGSQDPAKKGRGKATPGGVWAQGEMLRLGLARVYSFADNRGRVGEMLALEREARSVGRGIWQSPFFRVRRVEEAPQFIGSFELVEGRVLEVANVRGRTYLNFGSDWRRDFTIAIDAKARRSFERADKDSAAYAQRIIRVRGWIKSENGPMIEATHPEQIEVIDE